MKRFLLIALVVLITGTSLAWAQNPAVTTIPVDSVGFSIKLSPDGHTLAVYNAFIINNNTPDPQLIPIHLYDISTGQQIGTLGGFTDWVTGISFTSDGSRMASFHRNGDLVLWDVAGQRMIKMIQTLIMGGSWIQYLNDDRTVLFRASDMLIGTLDTETGAITHLFGQHLDSFDDFSQTYTQYPHHGDIVFAAATASPDGKWLVASTQNDAVLLWNMETGKQWTLRDHSEQMMQLAIRAFTFSSDSSQLTYFDTGDSQLHVWDVVSRQEVAAYAIGATTYAVPPDGTTVAWTDRQSHAVFLASTADKGVPVKLVDLPETLDVAPGVTSLAFSGDGARLVVGGFVATDSQNALYVISLTQ